MAEKRMSKSEIWFRNNVTDNVPEIKSILDLLSRSLASQFKVTYDPSTNASVYMYARIIDVIFEEIQKYLITQQKKYSNYTIQFGKNFNIGYRNDRNDEDEKDGNFYPVVEYIKQNISLKTDPGPGPKDATLYHMWLEANVTTCKEEITTIATNAFQHLKSPEVRININYYEVIVPILCIFIDMVVEKLKLMYDELKGTDVSEVSINVMGIFEAYYSYDKDEQEEIIEFVPLSKLKQDYKNDTVAMG